MRLKTVLRVMGEDLIEYQGEHVAFMVGDVVNHNGTLYRVTGREWQKLILIVQLSRA